MQNQTCAPSPGIRTYSESLSQLLKLSKYLLYDQFFFSPLHTAKAPPWVMSSQCFDFNTPRPSLCLPRGQQRLPIAWPSLVFTHSNPDGGSKGEPWGWPVLPLLPSFRHPAPRALHELRLALPHRGKCSLTEPDPFLLPPRENHN